MKIFIIFPIHLFENIDLIKNLNLDKIYLIEDVTYFTKFKFHKLKLMYHRSTMKCYYDYLKSNKINVTYIDFNKLDYDNIITKNISDIYIYNPIDHPLVDLMLSYKKNTHIFNTQSFMETIEELHEYRELNTNKMNYYHDISFYRWQRKRLNILIDENQKPLYGKWSFDHENRDPFDTSYKQSKITEYNNKYLNEAKIYINKHFSNNFGETDIMLFPLTFKQVKNHVNNFIKQKLSTFGKYEDASSEDILFGSHSLLSAPLNIGIITPKYVVDKVLDYFEKSKDKKKLISSVEAFIRQIIGWRSFTRFVYEFHGTEMIQMNLLNNKNKLNDAWFDNDKKTNFYFIDFLVRKVKKYAYLHHIERLMYMGNFALLTDIDPIEAYKWFMICFIDSYEWVMVPNVMGMSQYSLEKISMMTRPYFSSSAYIKRMSDYDKTSITLNGIEYDWSDVWNALYYSFIKKHKLILKSIYAIAMQVKNWDKMKDTDKEIKLKLANEYIKEYI